MTRVSSENTAEDNNNDQRSGNPDSREMTEKNGKFKEAADIIFSSPQLHLMEEEEFIFLHPHSQNKK